MSRSRLLPFTLALGVTAAIGCTDPAELDEVASEASVYQWPDDVALTSDRFDSTRQVALAPFGGRLHMVHTDYSSSTSTALMWSRRNGQTWSSDTALGRSSDSRPALTPFGDRLYLFFKPVGERRLMMMSTSGSLWNSPVTVGRSLGAYTPTMPSAMTYGDKLYLSYCASDGTSSYVYVDRYDGTTWSAYRSVLVSAIPGYVCGSALMAPMPDTGEIELIFNRLGTSAGEIYRQRGTIGRSTSVWYSTERLPMRSYKPLSVVTCAGLTHLVHGGASSPTEIYWSFREGDDWTAEQRVPNQWSGAGATLGCLADTTTVMIHNVSGGVDLMQSDFGP